MAMTTYLVCGCPTDDGHRSGCWLATAETIGEQAIAANVAAGYPTHAIVAVTQALAEAGYLRDVSTVDGLYAFLDALVDVGLLARPDGDTG